MRIKYFIPFFTCLLCACSERGGLVVTGVKSEVSLRPNGHATVYKLSVPENSIAIMSLVPLLSKSEAPDAGEYSFESWSLMIPQGDYEVLFDVKKANPILDTPLLSVALLVKTKDTASQLTATTEVLVNGLEYIRSSTTYGTFNLRTEKGTFPVFQVAVFRDPKLDNLKPRLSTEDPIPGLLPELPVPPPGPVRQP